MIATIFKHEWRLLRRDRMLWFIVPMFAAMICYAVYNGVAWSRFQSHTIAAAQEKARNNIAGLKARVLDLDHGGALKSAYDDPRDAGMVSRVLGYEFATLPPSTLSYLAVGQSDLYPYYVQVTAKPMQDLALTDEIENPTALATGRFDLGFVIVYLLPLLILALSFNLLSSEREQGTQALILSQPIDLRELVIGKVLLRAILIFATAIGLAGLGILFDGVMLSEDGVFRLVTWLLTVLAYGGFWFGLAIGVNALGRNSATNAMALVACWLLVVVILPSMLNVLAKSVYPVPSRIELVQATRRAQDAVLREDSQFATKAMEEGSDASITQSFTRGAQTLREYYQRIIGAEQRIDALSAPVRQRFSRQVDEQQALVGRLHYLSPAVMAEVALADLAGTGAARYRSFNSEVASYHARWSDYFMPFVLRMETLKPEDFDGIPHFSMPEETQADVAMRTWVEIGPLLLGSLAALAWGMLMLRRYVIVG